MTVLANLHNKINAHEYKQEGTNEQNKEGSEGGGREGAQFSLTEEFWLKRVEDGENRKIVVGTPQ